MYPDRVGFSGIVLSLYQIFWNQFGFIKFDEKSVLAIDFRALSLYASRRYLFPEV